MTLYHLWDNAFLGGGPGCLFQKAQFFRLHAGSEGRYFEWTKGGRVVASLHFTPVEQGYWRSPARGTFAGLAFDSDMDCEALAEFHAAVEAELQKVGARRLEVLPPPMAHDASAFSNQLYVLRTLGYEVTHCDLNHSLSVDVRSLSERMNYANRKRLRKCARDGLNAERLPLTALSEVYDTLAANRSSKGLDMSMTLAQVETMALSFPESVLLFGIQDGTHLAAAALCIQLSPAVLYVFCWGDRPGYSTHSPVVALAAVIYEHCQTQQVATLDIGTSTLDRDPNLGLLRFKRSLGFEESLKVRMRKTL